MQLAYVIGVAEPVSIFLDTHGTSDINNKKIVDIVKKVFELKPSGIRKMLDLARPIYLKTSFFGHFGREDKDKKYFPWVNDDNFMLVFISLFFFIFFLRYIFLVYLS